MNDIILKIFAGASAGFGMSLLGWFRKEQEFKPTKTIPNILIATIFGGIAGFSGMELSAVETLPYAAVISQTVNWGFKAVWRRFFA